MSRTSGEMVAQIKAWEPQASGPGGFADESALVSGLRAGRPEAYEALHAAYASGIYNVALRIVDDPHEAEDVAQEVLVKVLRGLPRERGEFRLPAWLYRVTVNAAFDHVRARKRRPVTVAEENAPEHASPVDEFERAELAHRVESTLKELPKRQQLALVLRDVHGLSVGETASVLGVTRPSADVLLSRARAGFRKLYLAGARAAGRCAEAERILAGGVGGGVSARDRARLKEHARACPDCRRTVELWGVAPAGLGLLLPQVALPAKLSLGATLAAAQAAGVALPAGLGAAAAAGAVSGGGAAAVGSGTAAAVTSAAASGAASAATAAGASHGLLETLGSAAGVKIATLAAVATAALGVAEVTTHHGSAERFAAEPAVTAADGPHAAVAAGKADVSNAGGRRLLAEGPGHAAGRDQAGTSEAQPQRERTGAQKDQSTKRDADGRHGRSHRRHGKSLASAAAVHRGGRGSGDGLARHRSHARNASWRGVTSSSSATTRGGDAGSSGDGHGAAGADQNGGGHSEED